MKNCSFNQGKKFGLEEIKYHAKGVLKEFDKICKKHNLKYSIAYGTLLGAIRHKGFIPWDDDIDVVMPREDYEQLMKLQYQTIDYEVKSYRYTKGFYYEFSKMIDRHTFVNEYYRCDKNMGVFIDIFPMDYVLDENNYKKEFIRAKSDKNLCLRFGSCLNIETSKNAVEFMFKVIIRFFSLPVRKKIIAYLENKNRKIKKEDAQLVAGLVTCIYPRDVFPKSIWNDLIQVNFDGIIVDAFKEYDFYLSRLYGDYMKLPPISEQVTHHDFVAYKKEI